jgi:hypothetical protein
MRFMPELRSSSNKSPCLISFWAVLSLAGSHAATATESVTPPPSEMDAIIMRAVAQTQEKPPVSQSDKPKSNADGSQPRGSHPASQHPEPFAIPPRPHPAVPGLPGPGHPHSHHHDR